MSIKDHSDRMKAAGFEPGKPASENKFRPRVYEAPSYRHTPRAQTRWPCIDHHGGHDTIDGANNCSNVSKARAAAKTTEVSKNGPAPLTVTADIAFRFLAGLYMGDHPIDVQREYNRITRELGHSLRGDKGWSK